MTAETLTILDVIEGAAVLALLDVVSEEASRGSDIAPDTIGGALALVFGTL